MAEDVDDERCLTILSGRSLRLFSSDLSLTMVAEGLQECTGRLCFGPHCLLTASIGVDGELRLRRPRAADVIEGNAGLAAWRVVWRAVLSGASAVVRGKNAGRRQCLRLPDGHGRLLLVYVSLLRQVLAPDAHYPLIGSPSSSRNRSQLLRVLQEMVSPGKLRDMPVEGEDKDIVEHKRGHNGVDRYDIIERMTRVSLRSMQPYTYCTFDTTVTHGVLEGCIHFIMCTEVLDDVLSRLRQILVRFLWVSEVTNGRADCGSIAARAQKVLDNPALYIFSCLGGSFLSSCALPVGTFLLPTVSAGLLSPHQGTMTPVFVLGVGQDSKQPQRVMLLRIDSEGGLLNFDHSRLRERRDAWCDDSSGSSASEGSEQEGHREVERLWTAVECDESQWEAAQMLYEWAWAHEVSVILTPSHVPPVVKTYGLRYNTERKVFAAMDDDDGHEKRKENQRNAKKRNQIFMVDEVDEAVFGALERRFQYWRHGKQNDTDGGAFAKPPLCLTAAMMRRGKLALPDPAEACLLPVSRVAHGPLCVLLSTVTTLGASINEESSVQAVLLELDRTVFFNKENEEARSFFCSGGAGIHSGEGLEGMASMLLVSPTAHQLSVYTTLLLKCLRSLLTAIRSSTFLRQPQSCALETGYECDCGFVRAGGALSIALARQLLSTSEAVKRRGRKDNSRDSHNDGVFDSKMSVIAAVLQMLSEALLEVPRRLAAHITSTCQPLRHAWLRLEGRELRQKKSFVFGSITSGECLQPLHVYLREDINFYRRIFRLRLRGDVRSDDEERGCFCFSDTESSESESDGEGAEFKGNATCKPPSLLFVEPIAATTSVLRGAIVLLSLTLSGDATAFEDTV